MIEWDRAQLGWDADEGWTLTLLASERFSQGESIAIFEEIARLAQNSGLRIDRWTVGSGDPSIIRLRAQQLLDNDASDLRSAVEEAVAAGLDEGAALDQREEQRAEQFLAALRHP